MGTGLSDGPVLSVEGGLLLGGWDVLDGGVQAAVVPLMHPVQRRELKLSPGAWTRLEPQGAVGFLAPERESAGRRQADQVALMCQSRAASALS